MNQSFDAVVIGGGHAGAEAARVLARGGASVALLSMERSAIGRMSCNPAIGGLAKGNLVKEIDALGGVMPEAADAAGIQFKVLNRSKGTAVQGPRAQCDRDLYPGAVQRLLAAEPLLTIVEGVARSFRTLAGRVTAVELSDDRVLECRVAIVTTGTFLRALMHSGEQQTPGGRFGESSSDNLSASLAGLGLRLGRLKTGTPPRIQRDSVDFTILEVAAGDPVPRPFSILTDAIALRQVDCHITHTGAMGHDLIRANLHRAPMFSGQITGTGPRYCPSIEDKVVRFAEKERHQVFVEPEGLDHPWLYLNGVSTSLPPDVQDGFVRSLPGFQHAVIARYGYAVEYDFVHPEQLKASLETRAIEGLFLAGQINGTSGYEEAAAQGIMAGINALQQIRGEGPVELLRSEAYTAVMIDDLISLGTSEPYRMFTSRAEHRLLLGCDTVYERLTPTARRLGVIDEARLRRIDDRAGRMESARSQAESCSLTPGKETLEWITEAGVALQDRTTVAELMRRPHLDLDRFLAGAATRFPELHEAFGSLSEEESESVVSRLRYAVYVERQEREAGRASADEQVKLPESLTYSIPGLSREVTEKLTSQRPGTLGQASRIPGITPAAITLLRMHLRRDSSR